MDLLLKRDENKICKHLVHKMDKWCVLHVASHKQAIELLMVGGVTVVEFDKLDEFNCDHLTRTAMCGQKREGDYNKVTYRIKHFI